MTHVLPFTLEDFVRESNGIEGINRDPTQSEVVATAELLNLNELTLDVVEALVHVYAPGKGLRSRTGRDVRVGGHVPPPGGPRIRWDLKDLLKRITRHELTPYAALHSWYYASLREHRK